jgi:hypothetical protein
MSNVSFANQPQTDGGRLVAPPRIKSEAPSPSNKFSESQPGRLGTPFTSSQEDGNSEPTTTHMNKTGRQWKQSYRLPNEFGEPSQGRHNKKTLSPIKYPPKPDANIKVYQNLETQMKVIMNKKDKRIASVRR